MPDEILEIIQQLTPPVRSAFLRSVSYPEEIRLERSDFGGRHFELYLAARPRLCNVIPSNSKLAGRGKTCD